MAIHPRSSERGILAFSRKRPLKPSAHALSSENLKRSAEERAPYYAPKDKMDEIATFLADVFEAIEKGKSPWEKVLNRLDGYFNRRFHGTEWQEQEKEFWEGKIKTRYL